MEPMTSNDQKQPKTTTSDTRTEQFFGVGGGGDPSVRPSRALAYFDPDAHHISGGRILSNFSRYPLPGHTEKETLWWLNLEHRFS